jgi:uroporphyrinogen decarboxylase
MTGKDRFERACVGLEVDRPPVWMMRQAGRTLPEYRALKEKHSFWELCRIPELACEVTMQPVRRFPVDAAIIFSDILVIPAAMGLDIEFTPAPRFASTVESRADLARLVSFDPLNAIGYVDRALRLARKELAGERALLGFSGAPYTLACYMVDGTGSKGFVKTRAMMHHDPALFDALLSRLSDAVVDYLEMKIEAGISAYQLFDTWACDLSLEDYRRFVLPHVASIFERLNQGGIPGIYYANGIANLLPAVRETGASIVGVDWRVSMRRVREVLGEDTVVQGNLDPAVLHGSAREIEQRVFAMLDETGGRGHIVNLGHGLHPTAPIEGIEAFVNSPARWAERQ